MNSIYQIFIGNNSQQIQCFVTAMDNVNNAIVDHTHKVKDGILVKLSPEAATVSDIPEELPPWHYFENSKLITDLICDKRNYFPENILLKAKNINIYSSGQLGDMDDNFI